MKVIRSPIVAMPVDSDSSTASPASSALPISRRSSMSSDCTAPITPPENPAVREALAMMDGGIQDLIKVLDDLEGKTCHIGIFEGDGTLEQGLDDVRKLLDLQQKAQQDGLEEINLIYKNLVETQVVSDIQREVEKEVEEEVDRVVEELFTEYVKELIPNDIMEEIKEKKGQLDKIRVDLHNSESMRANAQLRSDRDPSSEILSTLRRSDGTVSAHFPKTLKAAFDLDAETCSTLLEEYGQIPQGSGRDSLLNDFLQLCGIQYQMVRVGKRSKLRFGDVK
ncbi:hypothetical protein PM082_001111 [Marasmius tenuissimus]|nr:hypothetical protein PM082_001111 [Marasmius tenuissimus]